MSLSIAPPASTPPRQPLTRKVSLTPKRYPLSESRTVLSVQAFQERHTSDFAHLHECDDENVRSEKLKAEQARLEEDRRVGQEKRAMNGTAPLASAVRHERTRSAWRPLSLVQKREQLGHGRSASQGAPAALIASARSASHNVSAARRSAYPAVQLRSVSETPRQSQQLAVLVEAEVAASPTKSVSTVNSAAQSTYSWATSFSGETAELRSAAHYVLEPAEDEEITDTPTQLKERRKRIVAIAHTVRQLEGIGSRDLEDPTLYAVLEKAWYDRPGMGSKPTVADPALAPPPLLLPAPSLPPTPTLHGGLAAPFAADHAPGSGTELSTTRWPLPVTTNLADPDSPADFEFLTPSMPESPGGGANTSNAIETDSSFSTSNPDRSRSFRYSYASTLHDLALDGALQQGPGLTSEKAWMQPSGAQWASRWTPDFTATPPPPVLAASEKREHRPVAALALEPPISLARPSYEPERTLRKYTTKVDAAQRSAAPSAPMSAPPPSAEAGPSQTWGLGLIGSWWGETAPVRPELPEEPDFQQGESGTSGVQVEGTKASKRSGDDPACAAPIRSTIEDGAVERAGRASPSECPFSSRSLRPNSTPSNTSSPRHYVCPPGSQPPGAHPPLTDVHLPDRNPQRASFPSWATSSSPSTRLPLPNRNERFTPIPANYRFPPLPPTPAEVEKDSRTTRTRRNPTVQNNRRRSSESSSSLASYGTLLYEKEDLFRHMRETYDRQRAVLPNTSGANTCALVSPAAVAEAAMYTGEGEGFGPRSRSSGARRSAVVPAMFWLGFILPFLWIFGGWALAPPLDEMGAPEDEESGVLRPNGGVGLEAGGARSTPRGRVAPKKGWLGWTYHPDPWVRACRLAAGLGLPPVIFGGVAAIVLLAVLR